MDQNHLHTHKHTDREQQLRTGSSATQAHCSHEKNPPPSARDAAFHCTQHRVSVIAPSPPPAVNSNIIAIRHATSSGSATAGRRREVSKQRDTVIPTTPDEKQPLRPPSHTRIVQTSRDETNTAFTCQLKHTHMRNAQKTIHAIFFPRGNVCSIDWRTRANRGMGHSEM